MYNNHSFFFTSSLTFVISCLFDNSHSNRCEVVSHCGYDLHVHDDSCCWASFHLPVGHLLFVFFGKNVFLGPLFFFKSGYLYFAMIGFFHMIKLEFRGVRIKITEVKCHFHEIILKIHYISMIHLCWTWLWLLGWEVFAMFLQCKVTPSLPTRFCPFHTVLFGRRSLCAAHT